MPKQSSVPWWSCIWALVESILLSIALDAKDLVDMVIGVVGGTSCLDEVVLELLELGALFLQWGHFFQS